MEAHRTGLHYAYDRIKQAVGLETDRAIPLREAILACRKGGTVSLLGVYGLTNKFPTGALMNKGLTLRSAQQHGQRYVSRLLDYISRGELDPTMLLTHDMSLEESPKGYELFKEKKDNCVRAVFRP